MAVDTLRLENKEGGNVTGGGTNASSESKTQEGEEAEEARLEKKSDRLTVRHHGELGQEFSLQ